MGQPYDHAFTEQVRRELAALQQDRHALNQVWGADVHGFRPNPPAAPAELDALEAEHGIELPADYRAYLAAVGDGGAGPWQGLLPIREALRQSVLDCPDALTRPFAHGAVREDDLGHPYRWFQFRDPGRRGYLPVPEEEGMSPCFMAGSLVIAHGRPKKGAFPSYRLVLDGPERGRVWRDDRSGSGSVGPCESASRGLSEVGFREWMLQWLEDCRLAQQFAL